MKKKGKSECNLNIERDESLRIKILMTKYEKGPMNKIKIDTEG